MAGSSTFSSDSNPTPRWKYHVFLSFRGEDTRYNFTDHLYDALWRKGIITFRDDEGLERGEIIKPKLLQAIEESLFSIVILSPNYASSGWCLDELQKILECREMLGRRVLPVFYGVDPSHVRNQRESFAEAFRRHDEKFGEDNVMVQRWRNALSEIANISGYHSQSRPETELIEEIIATLWGGLEPTLSSCSKDGLVGIDTKLEKMYQFLEIGSSDVRFVGIRGMGGIGKTTLANLVFNQCRSHFDISCCLNNVREKFTATDGLLGLQRELLSKIKIRNLDIDNLDQGKATLGKLLVHKKVLLLLDDVNHIKQLQNLAGNRCWFGEGSRIIVTTRDMHLLKSHDAPFRWYEIEVLNAEESFELFCHKAFKRNQPKEGYLELSQTVVQYGQGLPLALEVLGSWLCARDISIWEDFINKIRNNPPKNILDTLKISYEELPPDEKIIFLDIACFFNGWGKDRVIQILENCGFHPISGIEILIERSLVKFDDKHYWMHDLLQEMGRKIVIQDSGNEISKQSRLWSSTNVDEVVEKNKGTELTEGIVLRTHNHEAHWDPNAFSKMSNLRILIILHGFPLSHGLKCFSDSLKVLEWNGYPLKSLPHSENLNKLVELKMHGSKIEQLWNEAHNFQNLKIIDLSYSEDLIQTPNLFGAPNLQTLILEGCSNLIGIHESVGQLKKLVVLNLKGCLKIKCLPSNLEMTSLEYLILSGCSALGTCNTSWHSLPIIRWMFMRQRPPMTLNISGMPKLRKIDASFCNLKDGSIPDDLSRLSSLKELNLRGNDFAYLPINCISNLSRLWNLDLSFCPELQSLPVFPQSLRQLSARNCGLMEALQDEELRKLFMFDDREIRQPLWYGRIDPRRDYVMSIPGSEIPAWFDRQKNFPAHNSDSDFMLDSDACWSLKSFIVDIPDCCRSNNCKWWGIAACFLFEPVTCARPRLIELNKLMWQLCFQFYSPDTEVCRSDAGFKRTRGFVIGDINRGLNFHHQFIVLFSGNDKFIQDVLKEGHNQLKIFFVTTRSCPELEIRKCAWRVIYKDEVMREAIANSKNMPSISNSPMGSQLSKNQRN